MQFVSKKKWFYKRFIKNSSTIKLGFNNLYIFPNKFGLYWIFSSLLLYILGTNLEANFTILLSYLMIVILIINLFLTHFNLHGLELISTVQDISYADSNIKYFIFLNTKIPRNNIFLEFINEGVEPLHIELIDGKLLKYINAKKKQRGIFYPGVIFGKSSAPMSLFNCWFYWKPSEKIIVAPKINKRLSKVRYKDHQNEGNKHNKKLFGEELFSLKNYQQGEKKSHIDWKSYAKTNKLSSKEFVNYSANQKFLKLQSNYPLEVSLEYLCCEINQEYNKGNSYGIELTKDIFINVGKGKKHFYSCLYLLAGYMK